VRAVQTAEIVAEAFGIEVSDTTTRLIPEARLEEFEKWCAGVGPKKVIAVVGHEPASQHSHNLAAQRRARLSGSTEKGRRGAAGIRFGRSAANQGLSAGLSRRDSLPQMQMAS
jgi:phosphohistidine phosphatase SixA